MMRKRSIMVASIAAATALMLTACTPGSNNANPSDESTDRTVKTDVSAMGDLTLTVWDQEVRGGQDEQMTKLNAAFEEKYPNITIKRVSQSFDDLNKTLRLALSGDDAPDVVQANNARNSMGAFVQAGQIVSLDPWAEAYGWEDRYSESVLTYSRYSSDGVTFGEGSIFGLPQVGEVVGVFYSKSALKDAGVEVPETWDDFTSALKTVKDAGQTPLLLGNIEKWPAIHDFGLVQGALVPSDEIATLGFGNEGASWTTPENEKAASTLATWAKDGYFNEGVNGTDYDAAWQKLTDGSGTFLIGGSWLAADLEDAMGDDVGFFAPTSSVGEGIHTTGGTGLPFTVTSASQYPDLAAAYIDFITNEDAMQVLADTGNLPVVNTADYAPESGVQADVFGVFHSVTTDGVLLPYLDYATPTMADTLGSSLQGLLDGRTSPEEFTKAIEKDYADFVAQN
ncbi:ABC transporter substrate-binding protein [Paramicrobacterium agarici]|nr:extracellular solute-binding protein [Microbacterium agarici]